MSRTQAKENCGRCLWQDPPSKTCRVAGPSMNRHGGSVWPIVEDSDWCGRFRECPQFALNREDKEAALDA